MNRRRPMIDAIQHPMDGVGMGTAASSGLYAKRRLLLLCARIGYSPHATL